MQIQVSDQAGQTLNALARLSGIPVAQVVDRLIADFGAPARSADPQPPGSAMGVAIYADYEGVRTAGVYDPQVESVTITDGPIAGRYKSPTGAAKAIVAHYKPGVSPHRNGWTFWTIDDGSRRLLQAVRQGRGQYLGLVPANEPN